MAGATIEVKYFNTFILKKTNNNSQDPIWQGSFGVPAAVAGGYPVQTVNQNDNNWVVEESRIRGGYNNTSVDFSPRAYLVEEEPDGFIRGNAVIYSGIYNSRTGINDTNVFSVGEDISKATDPSNGSIQKLYAEDTNLFIFQEYKCSRALIDKDAIYSAEGGGAITNSNLVIGTIQPIPGKYGISTHPESFAVYGQNKYFSDANNNVILKLQGANLVEISQLGMRDFFRDELNNIDVGSTIGFIRGGWDIYNDQYVLSLQQNNNYEKFNYNTVTYDDAVKGWTSFFDYRPDQMFSIRNNFYTTTDTKIFKHYSITAPRANFGGAQFRSTMTVVFNPEPTSSKTFSTVAYEGSNGWSLSTLTSDDTGKDVNPATSSYENNVDTINSIKSYYEGEYVFNPGNGNPVTRANYQGTLGTANPALPRYHAGFNRKENKYVANVVNSSDATNGEIIFGNSISGIKGFFVTAKFSTDATTDVGGEKQLFSVESKFDLNNGY